MTPLAPPGPAFVTVSSYVRLPPALTGSGSSVWAIERSASGGEASTVVSVSVRLFWVSGSSVVSETVAVLTSRVSTPGAVAVSVIAGALPAPRLGRVQVIAPSDGGAHDHPVPEAAAPLTCAGSESVRTMSLAVLGPAFDTVSE